MRRLVTDLPSPCEVCRQWTGGGLCPDCLARFAAPMRRCVRCAIGLRAGEQMACPACLASPPPWRRALCAVDYGFPWDTLVAALKYRNRPELAQALARLLAQAIEAAPPGEPDAPLADLVLPVPLAPARLAGRGYNQAWELARRVARALGRASDPTLLQRPLHTDPLPGQSREARASSLQGAFMVEPARRHELAGRHVALVDDVLTTGATAREACTVLLRAGAASVELWTLARTPEPCSTSSSSTPRSHPTPAT
jgi:ComF family protein